MIVICPHCAEMIEVNYPGTEPRTAKCPECLKDFIFPPIVCQIVYDNKKRMKDNALHIRKEIHRQAGKEAAIILLVLLLVVGIGILIISMIVK